MCKWDKDYIKLCKKILKQGVEVTNRTGVNTIKIPGYSFEFDLSKEFPALTTKQLFFRQAILEMLWIFQVQSNDVRWLQERGVHIWDEWEVDEDGIYRTYRKINSNDEVKMHVVDGNEVIDAKVGVMDLEGHPLGIETGAYGSHINNKEIITSAKYFGKEYAHTIGTAYGWINKYFQNTQRLIENLKNNRNDRRMIMSLWQDEFIKSAVLPSCVWSSEWDVTDNRLNCWVHQRSCDVPLGLPFNVTQYATLLCLLAHVTGLKPGKMFWSIKDAHIYVNQVEGIKEQIRRFDENGSLPAPELWINPNINDFFEFDNSKDLKDIKVKSYKHMGKISFPITQ